MSNKVEDKVGSIYSINSAIVYFRAKNGEEHNVMSGGFFMLVGFYTPDRLVFLKVVDGINHSGVVDGDIQFGKLCMVSMFGNYRRNVCNYMTEEQVRLLMTQRKIIGFEDNLDRVYIGNLESREKLQCCTQEYIKQRGTHTLYIKEQLAYAIRDTHMLLSCDNVLRYVGMDRDGTVLWRQIKVGSALRMFGPDDLYNILSKTCEFPAGTKMLKRKNMYKDLVEIDNSYQIRSVLLIGGLRQYL
jgi:hypothetical protein